MGGILCCISQPITDETRREKIISSHSPNVPPGSSAKKNFRSSSPDKKQSRRRNIINSSAQNNKYRKVECMSLEDYLLASPNLNAHPRIMAGHEIQNFKHLPKKVYPSSHSPDINQEFFTPRRSFSEDKLGRIDEKFEHDGDESSSISSTRSGGSGKLRKKVTFRLPEEADIFIYYTPKEVFEE